LSIASVIDNGDTSMCRGKRPTEGRF